MQSNIPDIPRQCERQLATIPIKLVLKAEKLRADGSAITVNISQYGARVRTSLALVPGEWVGVIPKGEFPYAIPSRVVWVREDEHTHWTFAGLEFLNAKEA